MPPMIATLVFVIGICGLFVLDRDPKRRTSKALWIPVAWVLIAGSRPLSLWLQTSPVVSGGNLADANPLDALGWGILSAAGIGVLAGRGLRVRTTLRANGAILLYFAYCALSTLWSDDPFLSFKHLTKALGDLIMVLIVVTDPDSSAAALQRLLSRTGFLLVPLSVLFIKYYPNLGRVYDYWTYLPVQTGVTTDKNMLGMICLVLGLGCVWHFFVAWRERSRKRGPLIAQGVLLATVLWLFWIANSMTSLCCFMMAGGLLLITSISRLGRKPVVIHLMVTTVICGTLATLFFNPGGEVIQSLGRDPTLTGRTAIWDVVLKVAGNPIFGTGFESFWSGDRLRKIWAMNAEINEAHNGYLEVFLNLGWIGVTLLVLVLVTGYRNVLAVFRRDPEIGSLKLAFFVTAVVYNLTEAAFKSLNPVWLLFLSAIAIVPQRKSRKEHTCDSSNLTQPVLQPIYEARSSSLLFSNRVFRAIHHKKWSEFFGFVVRNEQVPDFPSV
jgi:exopolysaccharide production protein ExoQ